MIFTFCYNNYPLCISMQLYIIIFNYAFLSLCISIGSLSSNSLDINISCYYSLIHVHPPPLHPKSLIPSHFTPQYQPMLYYDYLLFSILFNLVYLLSTTFPYHSPLLLLLFYFTLIYCTTLLNQLEIYIYRLAPQLLILFMSFQNHILFHSIIV